MLEDSFRWFSYWFYAWSSYTVWFYGFLIDFMLEVVIPVYGFLIDFIDFMLDVVLGVYS